MLKLIQEEMTRIVAAALAEDIGAGDVTTSATVLPTATATARMVARESLVVSGLGLAAEAFGQVSRELKIMAEAVDGDEIPAGQSLMTISGPAAAVLTAERVALNFVQRLSGIATLTRQYVKAVQGCKAKILDTRKTTPGLRLVEKYAVTCGGGKNLRFGLYDMVLIKDNHLAVLRHASPNPVAAAVAKARAAYPQLKIEVEADTLEQADQAAEAGADIILLDNMTPAQLCLAVKRIAGRSLTEASGGVNLQTVRAIAETGVDYISVGALTHSARAVDIALDFVETK